MNPYEYGLNTINMIGNLNCNMINSLALLEILSDQDDVADHYHHPQEHEDDLLLVPR